MSHTKVTDIKHAWIHNSLIALVITAAALSIGVYTAAADEHGGNDMDSASEVMEIDAQGTDSATPRGAVEDDDAPRDGVSSEELPEEAYESNAPDDAPMADEAVTATEEASAEPVNEAPVTVTPSAAEMQQTFDNLTTTLNTVSANIDAGTIDSTDALSMIENIATVIEMLQLGESS